MLPNWFTLGLSAVLLLEALLGWNRLGDMILAMLFGQAEDFDYTSITTPLPA